MKYIEAAPSLRLRPSHLLLMIYRYLSGIYQTGDLSALNYVKGFLDGNGAPAKAQRILTVSGHGIGEAEMWLAGRMENCEIDTVSFRMVDTQLLQFLRSAQPDDIETVFSKFRQMVAAYNCISQLVSDSGLVPYWCAQAEEIKRGFAQKRITVFSDHPLCIPPANTYDLIYVSHGAQYFSVEAIEQLRRHLSPHGWLAVLAPLGSRASADDKTGRFADSEIVREARRLYRGFLEERGYTLDSDAAPYLDLGSLAVQRQSIRFRVLASAASVLVGELILSSLDGHISDRARLEALDQTAARFMDFQKSATEQLGLYLIAAASSVAQTIH